jgi:hypothetical protein
VEAVRSIGEGTRVSEEEGSEEEEEGEESEEDVTLVLFTCVESEEVVVSEGVVVSEEVVVSPRLDDVDLGVFDLRALGVFAAGLGEVFAIKTRGGENVLFACICGGFGGAEGDEVGGGGTEGRLGDGRVLVEGDVLPEGRVEVAGGDVEGENDGTIDIGAISA